MLHWALPHPGLPLCGGFLIKDTRHRQAVPGKMRSAIDRLNRVIREKLLCEDNDGKEDLTVLEPMMLSARLFCLEPPGYKGRLSQQHTG